MNDGRIVQSGKYEDLIADPSSELVRQMDAHRKSLNHVNSYQHDNSLTSRPSPMNQIEVAEENFEGPIKNEKLTVRSQEEETETGRVKWSSRYPSLSSSLSGTTDGQQLLDGMGNRGRRQGQ